MAHHKSAIKRIELSAKQAVKNKHYKSMVKNAIKEVLAVTNKSDGEAKLTKAIKILDKTAGKKIIHKNKAANQKSRLTKFVNKLD
ncbi:30S ribosomal protein S20 [candidate division KSB1 bacterium]|nr:30S ribosomal protein S20 [candidate division KSB1 bacterium]